MMFPLFSVLFPVCSRLKCLQKRAVPCVLGFLAFASFTRCAVRAPDNSDGSQNNENSGNGTALSISCGVPSTGETENGWEQFKAGGE